MNSIFVRRSIREFLDKPVENEKIDYKDPNHNLWFLNICISNFNSMLLGT